MGCARRAAILAILTPASALVACLVIVPASGAAPQVARPETALAPSREYEPVVVTGSQVPDWSAGPEITARAPQPPTNYGTGDSCQHIAGPALDDWVASQVLDAVAPAALEVSMAAATQAENERAMLDKLWR